MSGSVDDDNKTHTSGFAPSTGDVTAQNSIIDGGASVTLPPSFLTEVNAATAAMPDVSQLLEPIRAEYSKVQLVMSAFDKKVEALLELQREEYTQAYEFHMFDVQQELHRLREKAILIANDTTREEKLSKLKEDEKKYREDAMRLDQETAKCRRVLQALSKKINFAERERDWLLRRLREAKSVLKELIDEHGSAMAELSFLSTASNAADLSGTAGNNLMKTNSNLGTSKSAGALDATSTESATYTLEVLRSRSQHKLFSNEPFVSTMEWKRKLNAGPLLVSRDASILAMDKFLREVSGFDQPQQQAVKRQGEIAEDVDPGPARRAKLPTGDNSHALASLVSLRACHADIRLMIRQCEESAATAQTAAGAMATSSASAAGVKSGGKKHMSQMSKIDSILHRCMKLMEAYQSQQIASSDADENAWRVEYGNLIHDLMRLPETYSAITDLLGQPPPPDAAVYEEEEEAERHAMGVADYQDQGVHDMLPPRLVHKLRAGAVNTTDSHGGSHDGGSTKWNSKDEGSSYMDDTRGQGDRFYGEYDNNAYDDANGDYET